MLPLCAGGVLVWGAGDVLGEFSTFWKLRDSAMVLANDNQDLKEQIGTPFSLGPWYNASIGFTAGGNIAMCTFQLKVRPPCNGFIELGPTGGMHRVEVRLMHACCAIMAPCPPFCAC